MAAPVKNSKGQWQPPAGPAVTAGTPPVRSRPVPRRADSTKQAQVRNPGTAGPHPKLVPHTRPPVVMGPAAWENGRDQVTTRQGKPPFRRASAADANPC